jgi:hypothetical protein
VSLAKRIGVIAALVAGVLLVASAGLYWLSNRVTADAQARGVRPGWYDSLRLGGRAPDVAGLALERTAEGDGSALVYDSASEWRLPGDVTPLYGAVTRHRPVAAADSALWRRLASDPGLDRVVAAARMREWRATSRATAGDSTWVWGMRLPAFGAQARAMEALILRAYWRAAHRDGAGARADLGALIALGTLQSRREPTVVGALVGRRWVHDAARACADLADRSADSARARRCRRLFDESAHPGLLAFGALQARPDTAALLAADTALPLGWRAEALQALALHALGRLRGLVFGIPRADVERLEPFLRDADPDVARLALVTRRTAERLGHLSVGERLRAMAGSLPMPR